MEVRQANDTMGAQVRDVAQRTGLVAVNLAMASDMAVHRCRVEDTLPATPPCRCTRRRTAHPRKGGKET